MTNNAEAIAAIFHAFRFHSQASFLSGREIDCIEETLGHYDLTADEASQILERISRVESRKTPFSAYHSAHALGAELVRSRG